MSRGRDIRMSNNSSRQRAHYPTGSSPLFPTVPPFTSMFSI